VCCSVCSECLQTYIFIIPDHAKDIYTQERVSVRVAAHVAVRVVVCVAVCVANIYIYSYIQDQTRNIYM